VKPTLVSKVVHSLQKAAAASGTPSSSSCSRRDREPQVGIVKIQKSRDRFDAMANNPYSNLSEEVQTALANLNSDEARAQLLALLQGAGE